MANSLSKLIDFCKNKRNIYIYGAGKRANYLYRYLTHENVNVLGFLVTSKSENKESLYSLPIISIDDFYRDDNNYFIITAIADGTSNCEILKNIIDRNIHNICFLDNKIYCQIWTGLSKLLFENSRNYKIEDNCPVEAYHSVFSIINSNGDYCFWRFYNNNNKLLNQFDTIDDFFSKKDAQSEFEELYGKYYHLKVLKCDAKMQTHTCNVYMAKCHVDGNVCNTLDIPKWITPIQVGAALTDKRICEVTDDTGDNISDRNPNYSECTALYWIWKNAQYSDYIGLCHYRRHFEIPNNDICLLTESDIDVLTTIPTFVPENVLTFMQTFIPRLDFELAIKMIKKIYPDYYDTANSFFSSRFYPPCNMMLMRYNVFNDYCKFAFSVTFEIERFYEERGIYRFNRYIGYIMECLFGIYLMKHKDELKIAYTNMIFYQ